MGFARQFVLQGASVACVCAALCCIPEKSAHAWDKHQLLMAGAIGGLSKIEQKTLKQPIAGKCTLADAAVYERLKADLALNSTSKMPSLEELCQGGPLTPERILLSSAVDEPDGGMDMELPDSDDPENFRQWMGGKVGTSSQGFRHMYFGGWKFVHPLRTFQFPTYPIGLAPFRARIIAEKAKSLLHSGDAAWGWRLLAWAMHYVQDLAQPFHSVQVVSFRMLPLSTLLEWPPSEGFKHFVAESTRTIGNYHWALEQYVRASLEDGAGGSSPFEHCLEQPESYMTVHPSSTHEPGKVSYHVAHGSITVALTLGQAEMKVFGTQLMKPEYDLVHGKGTLDYKSMIRLGEGQFNPLLCSALANASWGTRELVHEMLEN